MSETKSTDYYELLQISPNAEPETIHRVYRMLAQRFHPDNQETGDERRFRMIHDAYGVLSDSEKRAQYDVFHLRHRQDRWKLVSAGTRTDTDVDFERLARLTLLEVLYTRRRVEPQDPGLFDCDLEDLVGQPREHMEFTVWYLIQRGLIKRSDQSRLTITVQGVDYLEDNFSTTLQPRRLPKANEAA
jgi:curved DNA-binding protein CbpA